MPKSIFVAVRDRALGAFQRPFLVPSLGVAKRSFADEVNRSDSEMSKHPTDYELYSLALFDDETGMFESNVPTLLDRAEDVVTK